MKFWEKSAKISLQKHMEVIMMKLVSMLLTLCMVFCMLTVPAAADDLPVVKLDVGTTETYDDTNYKVDANTIILRAEDRVYELTGTTDRKILVPGTSTPAEPKTYHIRLNNATINGGVTINNSTGAKLVIEVAAGTVNTVKRIYSASLTITGSGTLNMEDMGVTQSTRTNNPSSLYIEDTTINVNLPSTKSGQWEGNCKLGRFRQGHLHRLRQLFCPEAGTGKRHNPLPDPEGQRQSLLCAGRRQRCLTVSRQWSGVLPRCHDHPAGQRLSGG